MGLFRWGRLVQSFSLLSVWESTDTRKKWRNVVTSIKYAGNVRGSSNGILQSLIKSDSLIMKRLCCTMKSDPAIVIPQERHWPSAIRSHLRSRSTHITTNAIPNSNNETEIQTMGTQEEEGCLGALGRIDVYGIEPADRRDTDRAPLSRPRVSFGS